MQFLAAAFLQGFRLSFRIPARTGAVEGELAGVPLARQARVVAVCWATAPHVAT